MHEPYDIVKTIRLTEKATLLSEKENKYVFRVAPYANKHQIKQAVEKLFGKKVIAVNTSTVQGKERRQRTAAAGRTSNWKKAVVQLREGDKIELA
jgi:large subunit ribosomal protein L23